MALPYVVNLTLLEGNSMGGVMIMQHKLAHLELNYYRLKPVGWKINRKLRTEVLRLRLRNSKTVTAVTRLGAVLTADVLHNHLVRYVPA